MAVAHGAAAAGAASFVDPWPNGESINGIVERSVTFPSHSPFSLAYIGNGANDDPPEPAVGTLFLPAPEKRNGKAPAVVMLHGSAGVLPTREYTYGRQLAAMGFAALAIDTFAARRARATSFLDRVIEITEAMFLADAYSALKWLGTQPEVDGDRVALMGFSYGAMATVYAAFSQVAEKLAPGGERFAAHIAFYGPCIARFRDSRATGAPVAMLYGTEDEIIDPVRCLDVKGDLEKGGAKVDLFAFSGAYHQWDGGRAGPFRIGRTLNGCRLTVDQNLMARDADTGLSMSGPFMRKIILGLCSGGSGYLIGRDDTVREKSNRVIAAILTRAFRR
ncbi:MAG: dienelactone hydrolase family protein [Rhodospirillales bacterium]